MHCIYISIQITENVKVYCRTFPRNPLHERITQYHPIGFKYYYLQPYLLLPPWASGITTFNLTTTLMGFRYYHLQPYKLLPP